MPCEVVRGRRGGTLEVCALSWRPVGRRDPVLRGVDLRLAPGERVLLVGPSGAGKSTLLRAMAGLLLTADAGDLSGQVRLNGHPPGQRAGEVGLVLQEPGAGVVAATIGRDVAFGLENVGVAPAAMPDLVGEALAAVGLDPLPPDTPTTSLSGGQTQRLALAGSLAMAPELLLLDEPTAMLDAENAAGVRQAVADAMATGLTTVVVEHVLAPWVDLVDRLVVLCAEGRIVADGPVGQVLRDRRDDLLEMGIWVPDAPVPTPAFPPETAAEVFAQVGGDERSQAGPVALHADPLSVHRRSRLIDGTTRKRLAARTTATIEAAPATLTALVGPSGSGKSTVLHALAGFLTADDPAAVTVPSPQAGSARGVPGPAREPVSATAGDSTTTQWTTPDELSPGDLARSLAWVPQWSSSTIVTTTVREEILLTSRALGRDETQAQQRADTLMRLIALDHLAQADPRDLSGGEQRRLAIAAALLHRPAVLLADEPTIGQDRHTWAAVVALVAAYRRAGGAVVVATHDPHVVARAGAVHELRIPAAPTEPLAPVAPDEADGTGAAAAPPVPPRRPLLTRAGPLAMLVAAAMAVPAGVVAPQWQTSLVVLAVQVVLCGIALTAPGPGPRPSGRLRRLAVRMLPGLLAAASVAWSTWLIAGHDTDAAATVALRVLVIVLPSALLVPYLDPDALGDHLAQRLGLPDRPVVATVAALQRVHTFTEIVTEITRARRVRGVGWSWRRPRTIAAHLWAVTMGLLVRSLRSAAELAVAMDARGFATAFRRTWAAPAPWRLPDTILVAASAIPLFVALTVRF